MLSPGARVDYRAYGVLAHAIANEGHQVVVLKCAFVCAAPALAADEIWAVGGHSLGGEAAAAFAGNDDSPADGPALWASFPASDLSAITIPVASGSGSEDGLATPDDIEGSKPDLPSTTVLTAVKGGDHDASGCVRGPRLTVEMGRAHDEVVKRSLIGKQGERAHVRAATSPAHS